MRKLSLILLLTTLLLGIAAFRSDNNDFLEKLKSGLQSYINLYPEKVYVHTDKPYYTSGEVIWFKAYLVHAATHEPLPISRLLYVELIDMEDKVVMKRYIRIEEGGGAGDFGLEPELPSGTYRIRAYTSHMRNFGEERFFQTPVTIWNQGVAPQQAFDSAPPLSVQTAPSQKGPAVQVGFYPEGGDLVYGLKSMVALKATGRDGRGVEISGKVVDQDGEEITAFKTARMGMGVFPLTPQPGRQYQAMVTYEGSELAYPLPQPLEEGYVMKVSRRPGILNLTVNASEGLSAQDVIVIGHTRGILLGAITPTEGLADGFSGSFPTDEAPDGVLTLTLFTQTGEPLAERLVFIDNPGQGAQLDLKTNKPEYGKREKVNMELQLTDPAGQALSSNLSVAVTNRDLVDRSEEYSDLRTYLLLHSDLRGYIENAGYYFEEAEDPARIYQLDLLMMTQGWRRFTWKEILSEEKRPLEYPLEQGFTVRGRITELNSDKPVQSLVWLNAFNEEEISSYRFLTREDGAFQFFDVDVPDTTEVIVQARKPTRKMQEMVEELADNIPEKPKGNANVSIHPDPVPSPEVHPVNYLIRSVHQEKTAANYVEESQKIRTVDSMYGGLSVQLSEVVVTARAPARDRFDRPGMLYSVPSNRIMADSLQKTFPPQTVLDYLRFTPGVLVSGSGIYQQVTVRGGTDILYLLDGMPIDVAAIQSISPWDVDFIDVLKGPATSIYGGRGSDGVIAVYTRIGPGETQEVARGPGIANFTHPGYYKAREFYAPTYDQKRDQEKPDFRTTLYWNPMVKTGEDGKTGLSFFTSDDPGTYDIIIQGMTKAGYPVSKQFTLQVKE